MDFVTRWWLKRQATTSGPRITNTAMRSRLVLFIHGWRGTSTSVRRQGFWNRWLDDLEERLAHLFVDLKRLDCGIANAVV
jgi:hypothetical protein